MSVSTKAQLLVTLGHATFQVPAALFLVAGENGATGSAEGGGFFAQGDFHRGTADSLPLLWGPKHRGRSWHTLVRRKRTKPNDTNSSVCVPLRPLAHLRYVPVGRRSRNPQRVPP